VEKTSSLLILSYRHNPNDRASDGDVGAAAPTLAQNDLPLNSMASQPPPRNHCVF
jgi:hypothetical protein